MEKELRKQQNFLVEAGLGVILFAVWSVIRVNLYLGLSPIFLEELYKAAIRDGISEKLLLVFMIIVLAVILLWQLGIRLYIGLSAIAEGQGKAKGYGYLVVAALLLVSDFRINWRSFGVERILADEGISLDLIVAFIMEMASMYVLLELLISGIRVKKLRNKTKV